MILNRQTNTKIVLSYWKRSSKWERNGIFLEHSLGPHPSLCWNNWLSSAPCPSPTIVFIPTWWWSMNSDYPACSVLGTEEGALLISVPCAGFSGFTIGSLEVRECLPPTSRKCVPMCAKLLTNSQRRRLHMCALLQSRTNASTHNYSSEITNKKKGELEDMQLCDSSDVYFSPMKTKLW